jgi:hypothetical protein
MAHVSCAAVIGSQAVAHSLCNGQLTTDNGHTASVGTFLLSFLKHLARVENPDRRSGCAREVRRSRNLKIEETEIAAGRGYDVGARFGTQIGHTDYSSVIHPSARKP